MGKYQEWKDVRAELDVWFIANGIYEWCEIKLEGCKVTEHVAYAHSKQRRYIVKPTVPLYEGCTYSLQNQWQEYERDIREVVRACQTCHQEIEKLGDVYLDNPMAKIVKKVIYARNKSLSKWTMI